jgi:hypothetical protein
MRLGQRGPQWFRLPANRAGLSVNGTPVTWVTNNQNLVTRLQTDFAVEGIHVQVVYWPD